MPEKPGKTVYYSDPLNDDFAGTHIKTEPIDKSYRYSHGKVWNFFSSVFYYGIAIPLVWFLHRVIGGVKFIDRKKRKKIPGACFLYGNHTAYSDAYTPALLSFPRRAEVLAGADAFSIKGLRTVVQMLGAIAVPNRISGMKHFMDTVEKKHEEGHDIAIFPEAHIWPYYTGVRPFTAASFAYPVRMNSPVTAFFVAYSRPKGIAKLFRKADKKIYLSDPIYPDLSLPHKEAQQKLRDEVYMYMKRVSESCSTYSVIEYVRREKTEPENSI